MDFTFTYTVSNKKRKQKQQLQEINKENRWNIIQFKEKAVEGELAIHIKFLTILEITLGQIYLVHSPFRDFSSNKCLAASRLRDNFFRLPLYVHILDPHQVNTSSLIVVLTWMSKLENACSTSSKRDSFLKTYSRTPKPIPFPSFVHGTALSQMYPASFAGKLHDMSSNNPSKYVL